jgi:hypothetical protein
MVHCIAFGCSNNDADIKRGVSFFTVAIKKPDLLKQWLAKLRLEDPNVTKNSRVCPEHFSSDRFEPDLKAELLGPNSSEPQGERKPMQLQLKGFFKEPLPKK